MRKKSPMDNIFVVSEYQTPRMNQLSSRNSHKIGGYMLEKGFESFSRSMRGSGINSSRFSTKNHSKGGLSKRSSYRSPRNAGIAPEDRKHVPRLKNLKIQVGSPGTSSLGSGFGQKSGESFLEKHNSGMFQTQNHINITNNYILSSGVKDLMLSSSKKSFGGGGVDDSRNSKSRGQQMSKEGIRNFDRGNIKTNFKDQILRKKQKSVSGRKLSRTRRIKNIDLLKREFNQRKSRLLNTSQEVHESKYLKVSNKKLRALRRKESKLQEEYSSFDGKQPKQEHQSSRMFKTMDQDKSAMQQSQRMYQKLFRTHASQKSLKSSKLSHRSSKSKYKANFGSRLLNSTLVSENSLNTTGRSRVEKIAGGKRRKKSKLSKRHLRHKNTKAKSQSALAMKKMLHSSNRSMALTSYQPSGSERDYSYLNGSLARKVRTREAALGNSNLNSKSLRRLRRKQAERASRQNKSNSALTKSESYRLLNSSDASSKSKQYMRNTSQRSNRPHQIYNFNEGTKLSKKQQSSGVSIRRKDRPYRRKLKIPETHLERKDYSTKVILGAMNSRKRKQIELEARSNQRNIKNFGKIAYEKLSKTETQIKLNSPYNIKSSLGLLKNLISRNVKNERGRQLFRTHIHAQANQNHMIQSKFAGNQEIHYGMNPKNPKGATVRHMTKKHHLSKKNLWKDSKVPVRVFTSEITPSFGRGSPFKNSLQKKGGKPYRS